MYQKKIFSGDVELMVSDLMHSGQMLHWCSRHNYLVLADIWGQRYIRFEENEPVTTTVIPDTTTEVVYEYGIQNVKNLDFLKLEFREKETPGRHDN